MAHIKTEYNSGEGIELKAGQDAPPTVCVAHFLNMSENNLFIGALSDGFRHPDGRIGGNLIYLTGYLRC